MKNIFRIVNVCEPQAFTKSDGTQMIKQQLVLRELGGPYEDAFVVTWLGKESLQLATNMCIAASIRMRVSESVYSAGPDQAPETRYYQDAVLQEYAGLMIGSVRN